jgi:hypothetical protein
MLLPRQPLTPNQLRLRMIVRRLQLPSRRRRKIALRLPTLSSLLLDRILEQEMQSLDWSLLKILEDSS